MNTNEQVTIPRSVLGTLLSAAEVRMEQYARHAAGRDPYATDCIIECDAEEAENLESLYRDALAACRAIVGSTG
jgi:hypothetical protein